MVSGAALGNLTLDAECLRDFLLKVQCTELHGCIIRSGLPKAAGGTAATKIQVCAMQSRRWDGWNLKCDSVSTDVLVESLQERVYSDVLLCLDLQNGFGC